LKSVIRIDNVKLIAPKILAINITTRQFKNKICRLDDIADNPKLTRKTPPNHNGSELERPRSFVAMATTKGMLIK
jgi:hypothetical protein